MHARLLLCHASTRPFAKQTSGAGIVAALQRQHHTYRYSNHSSNHSHKHLSHLHDRCPDCVRAVPAVVRVCAEKKASLLLCNVGARADWKTPAHPFRTDPALQLKGIPTLIEWDGGKPGDR